MMEKGGEERKQFQCEKEKIKNNGQKKLKNDAKIIENVSKL